MSLSVRLYISGGSPDYKLKAKTVTVAIQRNPLQAGLAGGTSPLLTDLGFFVPMVIVEGTVDTVSPGTDADGKTIPSQQNLEDFVVDNGFNNAIAVDISLSPSGSTVTSTYTCKIKSLRCHLPAGQEMLWDFTLELVTIDRA